MSLSDRALDPASAAAIRFGFGLPAGAADAGGLMAALAAPDGLAARYRVRSMAAVAQDFADMRAARAAERAGAAGAVAARDALRRRLARDGRRQLRSVLARIADAEDGFRERLTWFWADHFSAAPPGLAWRSGPVAFAEEAIRPHIAGPFAAMLRAAVTHPLMLVYLDQARSVGPNSAAGQRRGRGLNENLAREVLELHTLGVGAGYRQRDVRQLAELLTGLRVGDAGRARFVPGWAEPGAEAVLGVRYGGGAAALDDIHAVLGDLARRPETAAHLSRKLAAHFVADDPAPDLVGAMAAAWADTEGDLAAVYGAMLAHPAAWAGVGAKVKRPFELLASGLRALGVRGAAVAALDDAASARVLDRPLRRMGQRFRAAPGPDGWPDRAEDWLHPQGLAARIRWAGEMAATFPGDPAAVMARGLGAAASGPLRAAAVAAPDRATAVMLVLAAPEFNRR